MSQPSSAVIAATVAAYGGSLVAGFAASALHVPLPWMIGPLLFTTAFGFVRSDAIIPDSSRPLGQMVVAAVVGLAFTPQALAAIAEHLLAMVVVSLGTIVAGCAAAVVLRRFSRIGTMTALIASIPGGPAEMSALAQRNGVPAGPVVVVQTMRIAFLVLIVPPVVVALTGAPDNTLLIAEAAGGSLSGVLLLGALAVAGGVLFRLLRVNSPFFLGSLAFSAAASAFELPVSMPPFWLLAAAQILLGTWLGKVISRQASQSGRAFILSAFASTAVLIGLTALLALAVTATAGVSWQTMVLATAPGSVTEMALTARLLHQDVALVTAFQVARIFVVLMFAPLVFGLITGFTRRRGSRRDDQDQ
ncbi:MAG: AbrB family transcriptional regulator [Nannocystaceae bacterium]